MVLGRRYCSAPLVLPDAQLTDKVLFLPTQLGAAVVLIRHGLIATGL